eukprot:TRINITY_DN2753_c0_g1_i1.p1 TRINITY_DN2753_c0_g1~~TRINITY_DN2753_c0_g1_i1.p1  ORF type:complete len:360 (+),score=79.05 TRINITY_DN2753_c0_g1_i1:177-1256(+)
MSEAETFSIFSTLPTELLHFCVFVHVEKNSLPSIFRVCKRWSKAAKADFFWEQKTRKDFEEVFLEFPHWQKPQNRNWCWSYRAKIPFPRSKNSTGIGTLKFPNRDRYEGEMNAGILNGVGIFLFYPTGMYVGEFVDGKREGKGFYLWPHGDTYQGEWANGERTGFGKYLWKNGNYYQGYFNDGRQSQLGKFVEESGWSLDCQWLNGLPIFPDTPIPLSPSFFVENKSYHMDHFNPLISDAIRRKICTFKLTGKKMIGQILWETKRIDTRRHGLCYVCQEKCKDKNVSLEKNSSKTKLPVFGGNFFCDCGSHEDSSLTCFAMEEEETEEGEGEGEGEGKGEGGGETVSYTHLTLPTICSV